MKKAITVFTLAMVLMVSSIFADDGILVAGKGACQNTKKDGILVAGFADGILVAGFADGILVAGLTGILVAGKDSGCSTPTESDLGGLIISD